MNKALEMGQQFESVPTNKLFCGVVAGMSNSADIVRLGNELIQTVETAKTGSRLTDRERLAAKVRGFLVGGYVTLVPSLGMALVGSPFGQDLAGFFLGRNGLAISQFFGAEGLTFTALAVPAVAIWGAIQNTSDHQEKKTDRAVKDAKVANRQRLLELIPPTEKARLTGEVVATNLKHQNVID